MGLFEFHRAQECIELGRQATERALPDIVELIRESEATV
jgi:NTE family protein